MNPVAPEVAAGADPVGDLGHQKGLTDFRRACQHVDPGAQKALDDGPPTGKGLFHQLVVGDGVQEVRVLGPLEFLKKVRGIRKVFIELSVCFCYTECVCFGRLPSICANRWIPGGRFFCFAIHLNSSFAVLHA